LSQLGLTVFLAEVLWEMMPKIWKKTTQLINFETNPILVLLCAKVNDIIAYCQAAQSKRIYPVTKMTLYCLRQILFDFNSVLKNRSEIDRDTIIFTAKSISGSQCQVYIIQQVYSLTDARNNQGNMTFWKWCCWC